MFTDSGSLVNRPRLTWPTDTSNWTRLPDGTIFDCIEKRYAWGKLVEYLVGRYATFDDCQSHVNSFLRPGSGWYVRVWRVAKFRTRKGKLVALFPSAECMYEHWKKHQLWNFTPNDPDHGWFLECHGISYLTDWNEDQVSFIPMMPDSDAYATSNYRSPFSGAARSSAINPWSGSQIAPKPTPEMRSRSTSIDSLSADLVDRASAQDLLSDEVKQAALELVETHRRERVEAPLLANVDIRVRQLALPVDHMKVCTLLALLKAISPKNPSTERFLQSQHEVLHATKDLCERLSMRAEIISPSMNQRLREVLMSPACICKWDPRWLIDQATSSYVKVLDGGLTELQAESLTVPLFLFSRAVQAEGVVLRQRDVVNAFDVYRDFAEALARTRRFDTALLVALGAMSLCNTGDRKRDLGMLEDLIDAVGKDVWSRWRGVETHILEAAGIFWEPEGNAIAGRPPMDRGEVELVSNIVDTLRHVYPDVQDYVPPEILDNLDTFVQFYRSV